MKRLSDQELAKVLMELNEFTSNMKAQLTAYMVLNSVLIAELTAGGHLDRARFREFIVQGTASVYGSATPPKRFRETIELATKFADSGPASSL